MSLCELRSVPLSVDEVIGAVQRPDAGAVALFLGTVRDHNEGRATTRLEYEAYPSMAVKVLKAIVERLEAEFPGTKLAVVHRVGALDVGDLAVVCAASAPHRKEALLACQQLIEAVKAEVPIWKREHGPDGAHWLNWVDARVPKDRPVE